MTALVTPGCTGGRNEMDAQSERDYGFLEGAYEQTVRDYEAVCRRNEELKAERDRLAARVASLERGYDEALLNLQEVTRARDDLRRLLGGLYGTVAGTKAWRTRWPKIDALVKAALRKED